MNVGHSGRPRDRTGMAADIPHVPADTFAGHTSIPRQLPRPPAHFTGRSEDVERLNSIHTTGDGQRPVLIVLSGPGGVGKTALSLQWANAVGNRFADGQLFVDLNGFSLDEPTEPGEALGIFLRALGTPPERVPVHLAEQTALYRTLTARKSLFVLLDNAVSAAQVRVLIPSSPTSLVVVNSRSKLTGLHQDGGHLLEVAPLSTASALSLLIHTVGEERINKERQQAEDLVALCGHLPIAVRIAASRLLVRPRWTVARVGSELAGEQERLAGLSADSDLSVRATFDLSYRMLEPDAAVLYRRLSLNPGREFGAEVASAALGEPAARSGRLLESLIEASLVEETAEDRFAFHDLVRLHARHRVEVDDKSKDRFAALCRVVEWYLATAMRADLVLTPYRRRLSYKFASTPFGVKSFHDRDSALAWLEQERSNLIAAGRVAHEQQWAELAWQLSDVMWPLLLLRKHYRDRVEIDQRGLAAAREWGNRFAQADMLKRLGRVCTTVRRFDEAERHLRESVEIWTELDDRRGVCDAREMLAMLLWDTGQVEQARSEFERLVADNEELRADRSIGLSLINLGSTLLELGRAAEALPHLARADEVFRALGEADPYNHARVAITSSQAHCRTGDPTTAAVLADEGMRMMLAVGSKHGEAEALQALAEIAGASGDVAAARDHLRRAEEVFRALGSPKADVVRRHIHDVDEPPTGSATGRANG